MGAAIIVLVGLIVAIPAGGPAGGSAHLSIVQLGDSVAAGEGTLYGYTYNTTTRTWTGGSSNVTWPGPYPLCHDSPDAYGEVVAQDLDATFHQFACTGSTFGNGIAGPRVNEGYIYNTTLRPAEFGNWATKANLNKDYDSAAPDVDLVTLGADDVQFVAIVEACIENGYEYYLDLASLDCTAANPGSTVTTDFTDDLPTLESNYKTLVSWITARGQQAGHVPKTVFTTYYDPLPPGGAQCPDSNYLYPQQITYLSSLITTLNSAITTTIDGLHDPDVAVANISGALDGHQWCSADPWAYGLSIYKVTQPSTFSSQAPFHPTPAGQAAIAADVAPVVRKLVGPTS